MPEDLKKEDWWKPVLESKTMWVNFLSLVALIAQLITGTEVFDIEAQAGILALINMILRTITNQPLKWK